MQLNIGYVAIYVVNFDTKPVDGGFQCILKIPQQHDFKSTVLPSISAAENDVAKCALKFLQCS